MQSSSRRPSPIEAFKAEHPFCCFCGGQAPTEQIDHVPPCSIFDDRIWPEGYPRRPAQAHEEEAATFDRGQFPLVGRRVDFASRAVSLSVARACNARTPGNEDPTG
jgi:hypothetical protein